MGVLAVTLAAACAADLRRRKIPNALTLPALLLGLLLAGGQGGTPALGQALAGAGVASVALLAYAGRMLGAGDVKLLWVVGVCTGPRFMLWALPCVAMAGGALALLWAARRGAKRLPYAPAIVLGVLGAAMAAPGGTCAMNQHRMQRGAALVEFAICAGLLVLILFGVIEVGLLLGDRATLDQAAREAARSLAVGSAPSVATNRAITAATGVTLTAANVQLQRSSPDANGNPTAWVTIGVKRDTE